jgi:asparagine synthase (glutamine-hydrolysing)
LREALIREGEFFETDSEVEVIAALYQRYREGFASYLDGMFAIAIADGNNLILARDRFGIKPLFYYRGSTSFAFASEMKALLPLLPSEPTINNDVLEETMVFGYPVSMEETIFNEIGQVRPGGVIRWSNGDTLHSEYQSNLNDCDKDVALNQLTYAEAVMELRSRILNVVEVVWKHGVDPKGIYLSGGLDSSLLALVASKVSGSPIATFTLTDGSDHPDCRYAKMVAKAIKSKHREFRVTVQDYFDILPHFIVHYEGIMAGGVFDIHGGIAFHLLSREIGKRMRIACSGEGSDELFGGYRWIHTHPLGFSDRIRSRMERINPCPRITETVDKLFPLPENEEVYRFNLYEFLLAGGLANYHLTSVDRSCGAFGFEVRPVYLHPSIVQLACRLPLSYKADRESTKRILRDTARTLFKEIGLEEVVNRSKQGMPAAVAGLASQVNKKLSDYGSRRCKPHPYEKTITSDDGFLLFDLFYYLMVKCRGQMPEGFSLEDFVNSGTIERLYN